MGKGKSMKGRRGMMAKQMHHSPGGKMKGAKGEKNHMHVKKNLKHQDPMV